MKINTLLKNKYAAFVGAFICVALWGTAFPLIKLGYQSFKISQGDIGSKLLFAGERFALAGIMVLLAGSAIYRKPLLLKKSDIAPIAFLGLVQTFLQYLFSYIGLGLTTSANTSIITGATSLISVILAGIFFKSDRLGKLKIIGCVLGIFGIAVSFSGFSPGAGAPGDFIILLSAVSGAGGNIITKKISPNRNPCSVTAWQLLLGGSGLIAAGLILSGRTDFFHLQGVVILLWLALVSSVSFLLWTALLRYHPVSRITVFTMLIPIFGTLWSGIILGENIWSLRIIISLLTVAAGIVLVNLPGKRAVRDA